MTDTTSKTAAESAFADGAYDPDGAHRRVESRHTAARERALSRLGSDADTALAMVRKTVTETANAAAAAIRKGEGGDYNAPPVFGQLAEVCYGRQRPGARAVGNSQDRRTPGQVQADLQALRPDQAAQVLSRLTAQQLLQALVMRDEVKNHPGLSDVLLRLFLEEGEDRRIVVTTRDAGGEQVGEIAEVIALREENGHMAAALQNVAGKINEAKDHIKTRVTYDPARVGDLIVLPKENYEDGGKAMKEAERLAQDALSGGGTGN